MPMPKDTQIPKISTPEGRKEIAQELFQFLEAAEDEKGDQNARAQKNESFYRNQEDEGGLVITEESVPAHLNIVQPRVDAIVTKVCNPMTSSRPYFAAISVGQDAGRNKECEDVVQFCLDNAKFPVKVRLATRIACLAAPAIYRVPYYPPDLAASAGLPGPGPAIEVIHPNDFFLYPLAMGSITQARLAAHRWPGGIRVRDIVEKQEDGTYFDDIPVANMGDEPQSNESGRSAAWSLTCETSGIVNPEDFPVEIVEGLVKYDLNEDGKQEWYRFVLARTQKVLLDFAPYAVQYASENEGEEGEVVGLSRPWYFQHYVKPPMYGEFFCANSPAQDLQAIQGYFNDKMTIQMEGEKMSAFPLIFRKGGSQEEKVTKYGAGEIHDVPSGTEFEIVNVNYDPSTTPYTINLLMSLADSAVRISQSGLASPQGSQSSGSRATATEINTTAMSMDEGADEYRDNAAMSGEEMSDWIRELVFLHYNEMKEFYGPSLPCEDAMLLVAPIRWEAQGKTSQSIPYITIQQLQNLIMLAPQIQALAATDPMGFMTGLKPKGLMKTILEKMNLPVPIETVYEENAAPLLGQAPGMPPVPGVPMGPAIPGVQGPIGTGQQPQ